MSRISFLQDILGSVFARDSALGSPAPDAARLENKSFVDLCDALLSERGEMAGVRIARALLARFAAADEVKEREFFVLLATRFDLDAEAAVRSARRYADVPDAHRLEELMDSAEPRRQELLRRLNRVPGATGALVRMRERLFHHAREERSLERIDVDFRHLFRSWFNQGFLVLREIDWHTPANVLEKIIEYEAVHAINSWAALRARLEPADRRCFAFFHPAIPDEPLIFVEVALTRSNPGTVREVLSESREVLPAGEADTAVFYSISNCQKGLAGVSFGNFLIKQVAAELQAQLPTLATFRTLSPVPGFVSWVRRHAAEHGVEEATRELLVSIAEGDRELPEADSTEAEDARTKALLERIVSTYLVEAKRADGQPLDAVARFHLGNGASLDQVLVGADRYQSGLARSAGTMVSYLYDLERVDANHEAYAGDREIVHSPDVAAMLAPQRRPRRRA